MRRRQAPAGAASGPAPAMLPGAQARGVLGGPRWLTLAIGSGAFAAFNGVFAKLTTASATRSLASALSKDPKVEYLVRAAFFGLNMASNAVMWVLFTRALTASTSSTRVSILNTSANFLVTAVLGMLVFGEELPLAWWAGAALLVAGSVIIGAREGAEQNREDAQGSQKVSSSQQAVLSASKPSVAQEPIGVEKKTARRRKA